MNQNQRILFFCIKKHSQKEIAKQLKWTRGAASTAIKRLVEKKLLKKMERGIYKTTKSGAKHVSEYFKNEEETDLNVIFGAICTSLMMNIAVMKEDMKLMENTEILYDEVRKIFFESVANNHGSTDFTLLMWQIHEKDRCDEHGFNFQNAFSKNAKILAEYTDASEVFDTIHQNALPLKEQFKRNPEAVILLGD